MIRWLRHLAPACRDTGGQDGEAEQLYKQLLEKSERAFGSNDPHVASALESLASFYHSRRQNTNAEPLYRRALAIRETVQGVHHRDLLHVLQMLASIMEHRGNAQEAGVLHQRVLALEETVLTSRLFAAEIDRVARFFRTIGNAAEAEALEARAKRVRETNDKR